ncbi:MAG: hypothetical protein M3P49_09740 [Actinomycetota bacterium]|nr:hypothetical protein [Actinomycetota bacterium]
MKSEKDWPPALLQRVYEESSPAIRTVLEYLAARQDAWVPYGELNKAISSEDDHNVGKLGSTLGSLTRRCDRYGMEWPFEKRLDPTPGEKGKCYRMNARVAEKIRAYDRPTHQNGA